MSSSILVIHGSHQIREQIIRIVTETALFDQYREARDSLEGYQAFLDFEPDLVICDLEMPGMDGFKFLQMVRSSEELLDVPIIILTSTLDRNLKRRGLEQGACDYINKPFDAAEFVARAKIHLKVKKLQDELRRAFKLKGTIGHLRALSNIDPLTNLCNRRFLMEILEAELQRSKRLRTFFSLIVLDIDNFKKINDIYGHQNGDRVLVAVAEILLGVLRRYDFASRYGGDEFVLLLPSAANSGGVEVAERVLAAIQSLTLAPPMAHLSVTASLGVATYPAPKINCASTLLDSADCALYQAKRNGRNRVEAMVTATLKGPN